MSQVRITPIGGLNTFEGLNTIPREGTPASDSGSTGSNPKSSGKTSSGGIDLTKEYHKIVAMVNEKTDPDKVVGLVQNMIQQVDESTKYSEVQARKDAADLRQKIVSNNYDQMWSSLLIGAGVKEAVALLGQQQEAGQKYSGALSMIKNNPQAYYMNRRTEMLAQLAPMVQSIGYGMGTYNNAIASKITNWGAALGSLVSSMNRSSENTTTIATTGMQLTNTTNNDKARTIANLMAQGYSQPDAMLITAAAFGQELSQQEKQHLARVRRQMLTNDSGGSKK